MALQLDILTLFPGMFSGVLGESIPARALKAGLVDVHFKNPRDCTHDRHNKVDDRPYGGGPGMVFKPEPVFEAVEATLAEKRAAPERTRRLLLTPQGKPLSQAMLRDFAQADWLILLCGHYEGFDERIHQGLSEQLDFEEVSVGDYVLSGGEIPAMTILDGVIRLLPGALGHPESAEQESFENGTLDFPQYTRPPEFRGMKVPEVLLSGNHAEIDKWRQAEAMRRTEKKREDLLDDLDSQDFNSQGLDSRPVNSHSLDTQALSTPLVNAVDIQPTVGQVEHFHDLELPPQDRPQAQASGRTW